MSSRFGVGALVALLLLCGELAVGYAAKGLPSIRDDTTTSTIESEPLGFGLIMLQALNPGLTKWLDQRPQIQNRSNDKCLERAYNWIQFPQTGMSFPFLLYIVHRDATMQFHTIPVRLCSSIRIHADCCCEGHCGTCHNYLSHFVVAILFPPFLYGLRWFAPEKHLDELKAWTRSRMPLTGPWDELDCIDLFGATQRVARCWRKYGYQAESYDIKLDKARHDITSSLGFRALLEMGARLLDSMFCERLL